MKDEDLSARAQAGKTKEQLINEPVELRQWITELEGSEAEHKRVEKVVWWSVYISCRAYGQHLED